MANNAYQLLLNAHLRDINPIKAGWSDDVERAAFCAARTSTILHYIVSGHGELILEGRSYPVGEGQCFLLTPKDGEGSFTAKGESPVAYHWVNFTGTMSHCFSELPPVFDVPDELLPNLKALGHDAPCCAYGLAADLLMFRSCMISKDVQECDYAEYAMDLVQNTYMEPITVASVAEVMALDRSYLSRVFRKKTGQTLQSYIHEVRVQEAKRLMMEGYNVTEVSQMCGFKNAFIFSKNFSHITGMSPTEWKKIVELNIRTKKNHFSERTKE
ncbi:MAG: helix-turn-helix domain-containing protein [Oscillospiraceae bacterium]|nr:helix-turn-helix domain-containing protein [Oscillospiraceae bacterium]